VQVNMLYRPSQTVAQVWLEPNESVRAESGAMMGMSTNVDMQTQSGGLMKGLKRMFGGESFFRNTFTAQRGRGEVLLTTPLCGDMTVLEVGERQFYIQNTAYVGSTMGVDVQTQTSGVKGWLSGVGFFMLGTQGQGQMIIGSFGALEQIEVDGSMVLDTGHLVAWDASLRYQVGKSSKAGWIASWLSGEGLVCHFEGRGQVWVQTRNAQEYGRSIGALLPTRAG
jgi:uncharacterized protein (TIGR00266 family)